MLQESRRIKKVFFDTDLMKRGPITSMYSIFPSHVPARGVPRQQKEREDLADGVTATPACETYELLPLCLYFMKSCRCCTVAFVAFAVDSMHSRVHSFAVAN